MCLHILALITSKHFANTCILPYKMPSYIFFFLYIETFYKERGKSFPNWSFSNSFPFPINFSLPITLPMCAPQEHGAATPQSSAGHDALSPSQPGPLTVAPTAGSCGGEKASPHGCHLNTLGIYLFTCFKSKILICVFVCLFLKNKHCNFWYTSASQKHSTKDRAFIGSSKHCLLWLESDSFELLSFYLQVPLKHSLTEPRRG